MSFTYALDHLEPNRAHIVRLSGRLDSTTSLAFEKSLLELLANTGARLLLDLTQLDYISSAGLRVVLVAAKRSKQAQGHLVLFGLQPMVREVFEISGFLKILRTTSSLEQALATLDQA